MCNSLIRELYPRTTSCCLVVSGSVALSVHENNCLECLRALNEAQGEELKALTISFRKMSRSKERLTEHVSHLQTQLREYQRNVIVLSDNDTDEEDVDMN